MSPRFKASSSDERVWQESQPMWPLLVLVPLAGLVLFVAMPPDRSDVLLMPAAILALVMLVLGRLEIELRRDSLCWRFGWLGWPRWRVPLSDIVAVEPARSRWREGWGIRFTREGMLYNSHGTQAVRLTLRSGRRLRLGSQEPQQLIRALAPRIGGG